MLMCDWVFCSWTGVLCSFVMFAYVLCSHLPKLMFWTGWTFPDAFWLNSDEDLRFISFQTLKGHFHIWAFLDFILKGCRRAHPVASTTPVGTTTCFTFLCRVIFSVSSLWGFKGYFIIMVCENTTAGQDWRHARTHEWLLIWPRVLLSFLRLSLLFSFNNGCCPRLCFVKFFNPSPNFQSVILALFSFWDIKLLNSCMEFKLSCREK